MVWSAIQMNPSASYMRPVTYWREISGMGLRSPERVETTLASVSGELTIFQLATGEELLRRVAPARRYVLWIGLMMTLDISRLATILQIPPSAPDIISTAT